MSALDCPLFSNEFEPQTKKKKQSLSIHCEFCNRKIKTASLIGCNRIDEDFMNFNYSTIIYHFCDFICAKLYDTNKNPLALDMVDYRKKYLTNQLNKNATIVYNQVKNILFSQMPIKLCNPITKQDFERCKNEYIKIL